MIQVHPSTAFGGGAYLSQGHARSGGNIPQPVPLGQYGGAGSQKDGTLQFCVDFCHLNMCTKKDSYPLPRIQEALERMAGAAYFSTMDFKRGVPTVHHFHHGKPGVL